MPTFEFGDVVKAPFPYVERPVRQYRPALVVSDQDLLQAHRLVWLLMVTSAENASWKDDVSIDDLPAAGLRSPSVVRTAKIATVQAADVDRIGRISTAALRQVREILLRRFATATSP